KANVPCPPHDTTSGGPDRSRGARRAGPRIVAFTPGAGAVTVPAWAAAPARRVRRGSSRWNRRGVVMRGALRGKWWPLTAICLANLMLLIDVTIVITAMPEIARELDAGLPAQQWVLD